MSRAEHRSGAAIGTLCDETIQAADRAGVWTVRTSCLARRAADACGPERHLAVPAVASPPRAPATADRRARRGRAAHGAIAPAGSGKTTLFAEWAAGSADRWHGSAATRCAGGPVAFWAAMADSLERLFGIGPAVRRDLLLGRSPIGDVVLCLLNELRDAPPTPGAIVLDDFHEVEDDVIDASLNLFLRHLPDHLRILVASRREPGLPIERLRAGGVLAEVRFSELRFSPEESFELLHVSSTASRSRRSDRRLPRRTVGRRRCGSRRPACGCAGADRRGPRRETHQLIGDYVRHEVFASEADEVALFLHDLAVVDRFTVELASAITERPDAAELIERGRGAGPAGEPRRRLRLVRDPLRRALGAAQRRLRDPERTTAARRRAATWLEGAGETLAALDQWLLAGEHREVLRLLALHHVELYDAGRRPRSATSLAQLAPETTPDLSTLLDLGWCQLLTSRAGVPRLRRPSGLVGRQPRGHRRARCCSKLDTMKSISCLIRGDWSMAGELARRGVSPLDAWWDDPVGRTGWNNVGRADRPVGAVARLHRRGPRAVGDRCAASRTGWWCWRPPGRSARHWPGAPSTRCGSPPAFGRRRALAQPRDVTGRVGARRSDRPSGVGRRVRASPTSSPRLSPSRSSR